MKSLYSSILAVAALSLPVAVQAGTIVNLSASASSATTVSLGAGTYEVSVISGKYNGWDLTSNADCTKTTTNNWNESFDLTLGNTSSTYSLAGDPTFSSAAGALSAYEHGILYKNNSAASSTDDMAMFTVTPGETVKFEIPDAGRCDLSGGVSLQIDPVTTSTASATPEPSTFGLIGVALVGGMAALRRKFGR